eukprot:GEMP01006748.1.p1 GENE.GEMP01006748.1~~GEMP01006748.1.p1  ORF type:complete len:664 (+),score=124.56 GEMP01006748.1:34-1992(+)
MADLKCKGCDKIIVGGSPAATMVGADAYHSHCMKCETCGKDIVGAYSVSQGKMVHLSCREVKTCAECGERIGGTAVTASSEEFHPNCFKCSTCQKAITGAFRTNKETGKRTCQNCIVRKTCTACKKVLEGQFVTALGGTYHPACFNCSSCSSALIGSFFQTESGQMVCAKCLEESEDAGRITHRCRKCKEMILEGAVMFGHKEDAFHEACFTCSRCDTPMEDFVIDPSRKFKYQAMNYICVPCGEKARKEQQEPTATEVGVTKDGTGSTVVEHSKPEAATGSCAKCKKAFGSTEERLVFNDGSQIHYDCFKCQICGSVHSAAQKDIKLDRRQVIALLENRYRCMECRVDNEQIEREIEIGIYQGTTGCRTYTLKIIDEHTAWLDHTLQSEPSASWHTVCMTSEGFNNESRRTLHLTVKSKEGVSGPDVGTKFVLTVEGDRNRRLAWTDHDVVMERNEKLELEELQLEASESSLDEIPCAEQSLPDEDVSNDPPQVTQSSANIAEPTAIDQAHDTVEPKDECNENVESKESQLKVLESPLKEIPRKPLAELPVPNENVSNDPSLPTKGSADTKEQTAIDQTHNAVKQKDEGRICTLENLRNADFCNANGIDLKGKENYLPDDLFVSLIGMSREAWGKMPAWKKTIKKKALGIF